MGRGYEVCTGRLQCVSTVMTVQENSGTAQEYSGTMQEYSDDSAGV